MNNLHFDVGFLQVIGKGNKERLVPIGSDAMKFVTIYIDQVRGVPPHKVPQKGNEAFVFLNRNGKKLSRVMVFTIIKNLAKAIGLKKTPGECSSYKSEIVWMVDGKILTSTTILPAMQ